MSKNKKKEIKIEIKKLCPMIAMISAGKTSILKVIFDTDCLESSAGIGTKFVNIIRYNPEVGKNPKFYHLILKNIGNGDYEFYKDPNFEEVIGKESIKKKNENLNEEYKKKKEMDFEKLFYMIEVGEVNLIEDKEYLKNYDLVDIPGVSEYIENAPKKEEESTKKPTINNPNDLEAAFSIYEAQQKKKPKHFDTIEKEMEKFNPANEKSYLTEIFRIIRNKMNNGIIVFSVDNYQHTENYRIIGKLRKVINKPIENFLVLLNKIDKSENREYDINTLIAKIMKYFPSGTTFNFTKNLIVPCSKIQLENEAKMNNHFYYLLYYHFLNFIMKSSLDSTPTPTSGESFIDFLKRINTNKKIKKKQFAEKINKIIESNDLLDVLKEIKKFIKYVQDKHKAENLNLGIREDYFEEEEIKKIKENLEIEEEDDGEPNDEEQNEESFNINDQEGNAIILYFYSEFKNKKQIPPRSKDTFKIINYFTMNNMKQNLEQIKKEEDLKMKQKILDEKKKDQKIDDISSRMLDFYRRYQEEGVKLYNLPKLKQYINSSIGILKTSKLLYIPMLGVSNAGKSTILNGIIGCGILPAQRNECTKKGILIKHWEEDIPAIRVTRFKKQKMGDEYIYFFESDITEITRGLPNIHRVLEGANGEFPGNEEDYFYEIDIKIKFVEDLKLDESLKEKICFIDLPGFGTNNAFEENEVYQNLMKSCNIFLFIVFNLKIKETDNKKMLDSLYRQMKQYRGIPSEAFIKKCLFIINCDRDQDTSDKSLIQAKNDIINVVGLNSNIFKDIKVCFFNAKFYENYIYKLRYYNDGYSLIEYEYNEYLLLQEKLFRGLLDLRKGKTFNKYLIDTLKDNIKNDIPDKFNEKLVEPNKSIKESVEKIIKQNSFKFKDKELDLIIKYITFGKQNLCNSNLLKKSNIDVFTRDLLISIDNAKKKEEEDINNNLNKCLKILDDVFEVDPDTKYGKCRDAPIAKVVKPHVEEDLNKMKTEISNNLNLIKNEFLNNDIISLLNACSVNISTVLQSQKSNIVSNLKNKNWESIQKEFEEIFEKETKELKNQLMSTLDKTSKNIKNYYDNCYVILNRFYAKRCEGKIIEYKNYISNNLGGNNDIESTISQIINDIISGSKTAADWDKVDGFFSWLGGKIFDDNYLNKIIDYIINHSTPEIKKFSDNIKSLVEKYKKEIIAEIESSRDRVVIEMEEKMEKELLEIKIQNSNNEKEKQKWEEEKRVLEEKKKKWEQLCKKYRILRDEIIGIRLTKE